mmetsp:Transcript_16195/g.19785  ORF Transcript_16195/g.19785 Transcript_16195/m.19785 type:complete len:495 (+) Transcript_16195:271-1755(+)
MMTFPNPIYVVATSSKFDILPRVIQENSAFILFVLVLTYILSIAHWIASTDIESKLNWISLGLGSTGILYLHYTNAALVQRYELIFTLFWLFILYYHLSTWNNNYRRIEQELKNPPSKGIASLRKFKGSVLRFFITMPTTKNSANQWTDPPFRNVFHVILIFVYVTLIFLHVLSFMSPFNCIFASSPLCCRYNYAIEGFDTQSVHSNFCSGHVRIAFTGSWSTGKTSVINAVLGHEYATSQVAPAPTTDKFVCLVLGSDYRDPIRSDDYDLRKHCELISHVNDVSHTICGEHLPNVVDVADDNTEFSNFVFFDMPGWQTEYGDNCVYQTFYQQLIEKMDYIYVVWDLNHGMIEDKFADFFKQKAKGTNYEIIYNRFEESNADMSFLNQQYAKMSNGQEILSEIYTMKIHENRTTYSNQFENDIKLLRSKIKSVNQTVYDNRKKLMKENLLSYRFKMTGLFSLRKLKLANTLVNEDLNIHVNPKQSWFQWVGIEL